MLVAANTYAITLPLTVEPPIQVSGVEVVDGYSYLTWNAVPDADVAGYIVFLSVNPAAGQFEYQGSVQVDNGMNTEFYFTDPAMLPFWLGGYQVYFGVAAHDYADNVSAITSTTDAGESVDIAFFADAPPAGPDGLSKQ